MNIYWNKAEKWAVKILQSKEFNDKGDMKNAAKAIIGGKAMIDKIKELRENHTSTCGCRDCVSNKLLDRIEEPENKEKDLGNYEDFV